MKSIQILRRRNGVVASVTPSLVGLGAFVDNGTSSNPVHVAFIQAQIFDSTTNNTINTPSGWSLVAQNNVGVPASPSVYMQAIFWKRLVGSESGSVNITCSVAHGGTDNFQGRMSVWRDCITTGTPYEGLATAGNQNVNMASSAITTLGDLRKVLCFAGCDDDTLSTPASGWTEEFDVTSLSGSVDSAMKLYSITKATAGLLNAAEHTLAASERWRTHTLALIPA
jgi:hypothetical protein